MANGLTGGPDGGAPRAGQAVVIGAGLAGCLAAAALAPYVERVVVLERDRLADHDRREEHDRPGEHDRPDGAGGRRPGLPQAPHAHLLLAAGTRAIDRLLPGTTDALLARGAHRIGMPSGVLTFSPQGWLARIPEVQFFVSCTRLLTDAVVREQTLRDPRVELRDGVTAVGLTGDAARVTGVLVRSRGPGGTGDAGGPGGTGTLPAALVVDASGSRSPVAGWLAGLGVPPAAELVVDPGVGYATRLVRLPDELRHLPALYVQADPDGAGQGGVLLPVEDGRWLLGMAGVRGAEPPVDEAGFAAFVAGLRHPLLGEIAALATPLSPVRGYRGLANRWRRFDRVRPWPDGVVVLGDAMRTVNPTYGHGLSVAALAAGALAEVLRRHGPGPGLAGRARRPIARAGLASWAMAVGQDTRYPTTTGARPAAVERLFTRYGARVNRAATTHPEATAALLDTFTLATPATRLLTPRVLHAVLRPRPRPDGDPPPFTPHEAEAVARAAATSRRAPT